MVPQGRRKGDPAAQFSLAKLYVLGKGLPRDYVMAYAWLNLAAAREFPTASRSLRILEEEMDADQVSEAQRISRELWESIHDTARD